MIHIVDYGLGNAQAFVNMYKRLGFEAMRARRVGDFDRVERIILPGVGAFDHAMELLQASGLRDTLDELVRNVGVPVLGVCVGMQMLGCSSEEGVSSGLGWIAGRVKSFSSHPASAALPMPHMGWNDVAPLSPSPLFRAMVGDARFYFLHSYYFEASDAADVAARADYGFEFTCAVQRGNVFGVQFHPEKSHHWGATLLRNFAEL